MRIHFTVKKPNIVTVLFCRYIIKWIRTELMRETNFEALQLRIDLLEAASWMSWSSKPDNITAKQVVRAVCNSLKWERRKNKFTITIDPRKRFPNSYNSLESVCRFLDEGNDVVRGCYFLKQIEIKYQTNIYDYWAAFKIRTQR